MNDLPKIERIRPVNFNWIRIFGVQVWFSYDEPIAFRVGRGPLIVHRNDWGPTTGRHLNSIDIGNDPTRVNAETFKRLWQEQTLRFYVTNQEEPDYGSPDYQPLDNW